ncbi:unnamed protein product [Spirodela intermedia]|uniref:Uncharacterized protein n=1 Tax=Spirodela intermedia TaxID=51605 RepID=A0A7I8J6H4_SPIIN|nr:unnamed protein product [Spirodela intermedia]CAA6665836.1 unnamed protein product [Spirodela intermedia]
MPQCHRGTGMKLCGYVLTQSTYTLSLLKRAHMDSCKPLPTPSPTSSPTITSSSIGEPSHYRSIVAAL